MYHFGRDIDNGGDYAYDEGRGHMGNFCTFFFFNLAVNLKLL